MRAAETLKSSHRPDGKNADALALILACITVTDASMNDSKYVPQRPRKFPSPRWETADALASTLAYTTAADAPVNYSLMYVHQRLTQNFPSPRWDFHMFGACLCLQGGGVMVWGGTVSFSSCTITGNTAADVRAHAQNFPSPRWEDC